MIIKDNMANMCAKVTSTYMEFTLAFGPKPEFSFSFKSAFAVLTIVVSSLYTEHVFRTFVSYIGSISYLMYDKTGQIIQKQIYVRFYAEKLIFLTFQFPLSISIRAMVTSPPKRLLPQLPGFNHSRPSIIFSK